MVIEQPELYPHQVDMVDRLRKSISKHRAVILQALPFRPAEFLRTPQLIRLADDSR
jgi:hypothetical protein